MLLFTLPFLLRSGWSWEIQSRAGDPRTAPGIAAPIGTTLRSLGDALLYQKVGPANTDWVPISFEGDAAMLPVLFPVFTGGVSFTAVPGFLNQTDNAGTVDITVTLPQANTVPSGTLVGVKKSNPVDTHNVSFVTAIATDTIDGEAAPPSHSLFLHSLGACAIFVSDGISNWSTIAGANNSGF